jgi:hypothetical protein
MSGYLFVGLMENRLTNRYLHGIGNPTIGVHPDLERPSVARGAGSISIQSLIVHLRIGPQYNIPIWLQAIGSSLRQDCHAAQLCVMAWGYRRRCH